jgi:AraC family transcriptional regulator
MNSVLDYIEDNLDGEITDDKIAALSANPKGMFQRIFTMITDMTLSEYVRKRRLTQAAVEIQNTNAKIIDIAVKYGYNSADYFTTAFKSFH